MGVPDWLRAGVLWDIFFGSFLSFDSSNRVRPWLLALQLPYLGLAHGYHVITHPIDQIRPPKGHQLVTNRTPSVKFKGLLKVLYNLFRNESFIPEYSLLKRNTTCT